MRESRRAFPNRFPNGDGTPGLDWATAISYCYYFGRDEKGKNLRSGFGQQGELTDADRSTVLADVMKFAAAAPFEPVNSWNHTNGTNGPNGTTLDHCGGNLFYADGHVAWMTGRETLLSHQQVMRFPANTRSYVAEQPGD